MWTVNAIALGANYLLSYFRCFQWNCADTRVEYGRFYFLNWAFASLALYIFYGSTNLLTGHAVSYGCEAEKPLPRLSVFFISEATSFLLLSFSYIDLAWKRRTVNWKKIRSDFETIGPRSNWRLYKLMWVWFPYTVLIVSYFASGTIEDVIKDCVGTRGPMGLLPYSLHLLWPLVWSGLSVAFLLIIGGNWIAFKWQLSATVVAEILLIAISYILVFAIIGPPDLVGLLDLCRKTPEFFDFAYHWLMEHAT